MNRHHYTGNTVSVSHWCNKCGKFTQHLVSGNRRGPCSECLARLEAQHEARKADTVKPQQEKLFSKIFHRKVKKLSIGPFSS